MTPDTAPELPTGTPLARPADGGAPRLADRLSALVGQAAARQEDSVSAERLIAAIAARVDASTAELRERIAVVEAGQSARMTELESLVGERLKAIEAVVGAAGDDAGLRSHVDEVGGALVLRLDEVLAGLAQQVDATREELVGQAERTRASVTEHADAAREVSDPTAVTSALDDARHQLATQLEEARGQLAGQVDDVRSSLVAQADASSAALTTLVAGFDETIRGHVGDLAAGVLELGGSGGSGITREDVDAAVSVVREDVRGIPSLLDGVAQAAQLDGVTATTTALREELDEVVVSLGAMRADFNGLQAAIERRVDDAALALAETLVAVITSLPSSAPAPAISYDFDDSFGTTGAAAPDDEAFGTDSDGDWAAADPAEALADHTIPAAVLDEISLMEESHEQAEGVDEGAATLGDTDLGDTDLGDTDLGDTDLGDTDLGDADLGDADLGVGSLESAFASDGGAEAGPSRRKGIFRR